MSGEVYMRMKGELVAQMDKAAKREPTFGERMRDRLQRDLVERQIRDNWAPKKI